MNKFGWWGKMHKFCGEKEPRMVWIGPMTRKEMVEDFDVFRHNFQRHNDAVMSIRLKKNSTEPEASVHPSQSSSSAP